MSRSNNENITNPATKFFSWAGSKGELSFYDKEKKENISVKMPFTFLLLDVLSTIKGYSDEDETGFYSNEVKNISTELMIVKTNKGVEIARGLYKDIKDAIVAKGAKYAQSCYIAFYDEEKKLKIGNIVFVGSSLGGGENKKEKYEVGAWMGFCKANKADLMKKAIVMELDNRICVKGATQFYCPKFSFKEISETANEAANELDRELQEYLGKRVLNTSAVAKENEIITETSNVGGMKANTDFDNVSGEDLDSLPF